jgi:tetratricopeptide (TPR) repeat protein
LLKVVPESVERDREEIELQLALVLPLFAAKGYSTPEMEAVLERVKTLAERVGDTVALVEALAKLHGVNIVRANVSKATDIALEVLQLAGGHPTLVPESHFNMGGASKMRGELERARYHFSQAVALYVPGRSLPAFFGLDVRVFSLAWVAHVHWLLGDVEQGLQSAEQSVGWAQAMGHPHNLAVAHAYASLTYHLCGDVSRSQAHGEESATLCKRYGFAYYTEWQTILSGWRRAEEDPGQGVETIRAGIANLHAIGAAIRRPFYLSLLAEALVRARQNEEARVVLDGALEIAAENGELWWTAELHRLRGLLDNAPEPYLRKALEIAQRQSSRSLELRAAMSLARLWRDRGDAERGRVLLSVVLGRFTEGHESADLIEARTLLAGL